MTGIGNCTLDWVWTNLIVAGHYLNKSLVDQKAVSSVNSDEGAHTKCLRHWFRHQGINDVHEPRNDSKTTSRFRIGTHKYSEL